MSGTSRGQGTETTSPRVERADELRVAAAGDGRLGGEEADPAVARREDGGMRLRGEDADHGHGELKLEIRERRGRGRVAGGDDELDAAALEVARDLGGEPTDLLEGTGPVREAGAVAEVDEILVRERDEALVQDGQPAHARVEDADRARIHPRDCRKRGQTPRDASAGSTLDPW